MLPAVLPAARSPRKVAQPQSCSACDRGYACPECNREREHLNSPEDALEHLSPATQKKAPESAERFAAKEIPPPRHSECAGNCRQRGLQSGGRVLRPEG